MTTCAIVPSLSFLLFTASFCLSESEEETTTEESKIDDEADQSEDSHIIIIIILSVAVCILSVALIVTCTIIFLQKRRLTSHPREVVEAEADLQNNRAQPQGEGNIGFDDIEEDSDKGTLPQQGSDDISVEVEESDPKYNRRRVRFPTPPHDELSDMVKNDESDLQCSLREEGIQAEVEDRIDSEQRVSVAKDTDEKVYQNIGKDGMLIPIDESEPGVESSDAGTGSDFPGVEIGSGVEVRQTGIGIGSETGSGVAVRERRVGIGSETRSGVAVRETRVGIGSETRSGVAVRETRVGIGSETRSGVEVRETRVGIGSETRSGVEVRETRVGIGSETRSGVAVRETRVGIGSETRSGVAVRETRVGIGSETRSGVEVRETRVDIRPEIGEADGDAEAEEVGAKEDNPYDNVIISPKNGGIPSICSSTDNGGDYMDMSTVHRTITETPRSVSPPHSVSPPIPESPPFNNSLPHFGLEEDRPQSGKSSSGNSFN